MKKKQKSFFYKNEHLLVRPFLSLSRFDLKKICNSWKVPLFPDKSNQKLKYQRNRIRKQILPLLRFFFNPQIDTTTYQFIEILNSEQKHIDFITARITNEIQCKKQDKVFLKKEFLNVLPLPIKRKIIKQFLENSLKKKCRFFDVEQVLQQISYLFKEQKTIEKKVKIQKKKYKKNQKYKKYEKEKKYKRKKEENRDKKENCKVYKLLFFPKTGSFFLL